jgi:hypothetical protein
MSKNTETFYTVFNFKTKLHIIQYHNSFDHDWGYAIFVAK